MTISDQRPNIILLMADQFRADHLGIEGNPYIHTPNLNFLASKGTRFSHAYTPCPSCIPARAMLWTGMSQWHTGILSMAPEQPEIPHDYPHTLAGELACAGYQTHLVGKAHFSPQRTLMGFHSTEIDESGRVESPNFQDDYRQWFAQNAPQGTTPDDHGVDFNSWVAREWHLPEYLHPTAWTMTRAIDFLKNRRQTGKNADSRPLFLTISFDRPHSPYVPPKPYWDMYINHPFPPPATGPWSDKNATPITDPNAPKGQLPAHQLQRACAGYCGEISFLDAQIGRLLTFLRRYQPDLWDGEKGNTAFLFLSDHGDMQGDHHLWRKAQPYEASARIPLILLPPNNTTRSVSEGNPSRSVSEPNRPIIPDPVSLADIMPTLLNLAASPIPKTVEGHSLLPLLQSASTQWRSHIHGEHGHMHYLTNGLRKYIWFPYKNTEQFFDLESDPTESQDLIADPLRTQEITLWRTRLVKELNSRHCGWTQNNLPHYPGTPLISPWSQSRWPGAKRGRS